MSQHAVMVARRCCPARQLAESSVAGCARPDNAAGQVAVELCWRTCISCPSNGEELARSDGVGVLGTLLTRCSATLTAEAAPTAPAALIAAHALRAMAGMAVFPHAQAELLARCEAAPHRHGDPVQLDVKVWRLPVLWGRGA